MGQQGVEFGVHVEDFPVQRKQFKNMLISGKAFCG